jgi:hypothetical protein
MYCCPRRSDRSDSDYDPKNYRRPITRHRGWRKSPETEILEYDCDPYPFFGAPELEGRLEEYWQRMRQRR